MLYVEIGPLRKGGQGFAPLPECSCNKNSMEVCGMNFKKTLAFALALVMSVSLLAACGGTYAELT